MNLHGYPGNLLGPCPPSMSLLNQINEYENRLYLHWRDNMRGQGEGRWQLRRKCPDDDRAVLTLESNDLFVPPDARLMRWLNATDYGNKSHRHRRQENKDRKEKEQEALRVEIYDKTMEFGGWVLRDPVSSLSRKRDDLSIKKVAPPLHKTRRAPTPPPTTPGKIWEGSVAKGLAQRQVADAGNS